MLLIASVFTRKVRVFKIVTFVSAFYYQTSCTSPIVQTIAHLQMVLFNKNELSQCLQPAALSHKKKAFISCTAYKIAIKKHIQKPNAFTSARLAIASSLRRSCTVRVW
jgi:hypothetical protein